MEEGNILSQLIDFMKPKAHDAIDKITDAWEVAQQTPSVLEGMPPEHEELIQNFVMGKAGGGGKGKGLRQLVLALKGKIKGGKMIPSQPISKGVIGKEKLLKGRKPKSELSQWEQAQREKILEKDINRKRYFAQQGKEPYKSYKPDPEDYVGEESSFFKDYLKGLFEDVSKVEF